MRPTELNTELPPKMYRRFLIMTDFWGGTRAHPGSLVIKMHTGGNAPPFFWAGTPIDLPEFYQQLGDDRSIYCFAGTLDVLPNTEYNIKTLANYYVSEMLKIDPKGPYLLGGFCTAALICYEMAKILTETGHQVELLALCERDITDNTAIFKICRFIFKCIERSYTKSQSFLENPQQSIRLLMCGENLLFSKLKLITNKIFSHTKSNHLSAIEAEEPLYTLSGYTGKVHLFYVKWGLLGFYRFRYFQNYWQNLALQGAYFHIVKGRVHAPPDWKTIASLVKQILNENARSS